jgi:hypothetical protein
MFLVPEQETLQSSHGDFNSTIEDVGSKCLGMGIEVFLVGKAFGVSFLLVSGFLRLLVLLKWVEMLEELGSLGWYGIV